MKKIDELEFCIKCIKQTTLPASILRQKYKYTEADLQRIRGQ